MNRPFLTFIDLIFPFLLGILVLLFQAFIKRSEKDETKVQISLFGIATFESVMRKLWVVRVILLLIALVLFSWPAFRNYAEYFPTHLRMEVFFDDEGTEKALEQFTREEIKSLNLSENWRAEKVEYISSLNKVLEGINHPFRFDAKKGAVRSKGENTFRVQKVETWGWQKYHIEEGKGSVTHTYEMPGQGSHTISSTFELLEAETNFIDLSTTDIYIHWETVIKPEYKQIFSLSPKEAFYSHNLIALTKVQFFPYLDIGKTVYLAKQLTGDKYIPVGYSMYYPD